METLSTTLADDLNTLAKHARGSLALHAETGSPVEPSSLPEELKKINWQRLICFTIPIYNLVAPMYGLPVLPVPAFCTAPIASDV